MAPKVQKRSGRQTAAEKLPESSPEYPSTYYAVPIRIAHRRALDRYNAQR